MFFSLLLLVAAHCATSGQHPIPADPDAELLDTPIRELLCNRAQSNTTPFAHCGLTPMEALQLERCPKFTTKRDMPSSVGNIWYVSQDGLLLVKSCTTQNAEFKISQLALQGCASLRATFLVPVPFAASADGRAYLVMRNETEHLRRIDLAHLGVSDAWQIRVFDIKPPPVPCRELFQLASLLWGGWGSHLKPPKEWRLWRQVRAQLEQGLVLLHQLGRVDFSLLVHALRPGPQVALPEGRLHNLEDSCSTDAASGCVNADWKCTLEPQGRAILCFGIIDYLTPAQHLRRILGRRRIDQTVNYTARLLHVFDCLGNLGDEACAIYRRHLKPTPRGVWQTRSDAGMR